MNFKLFNKERDKKILKWVAIGIIVVAAMIIVKEEFLYQIGYYESNVEADEYTSNEGCNVTLINLHGFLDTDVYEDGDVSSRNITRLIENTESDKNIKAIVLDIDSEGGYMVPAEEIMTALKRATKPTVALIRGIGLSSAYIAATGADAIFASKYSDVGSIGVTMSYSDNSRKNQMEGLTYNQLSTGKFKDTLDPNKPLTYEEKQLLMRDLQIAHENFVKAVAENRGLDIEKVRAMADGSTMPGEMALENGLIDHIGGLYEVEKYLEAEIGEPAVVCGE